VEDVIRIPFQLAATGGTYDVTLRKDGQVSTYALKIPAGIDDSAKLRIAGQGEPGANGGPPGDVIVTVRVAPHPYLRREGDNVLLDLPITVVESTLGAKVDCPTLDGDIVSLTVPPGTSSGAKLRLKGKGFPNRKSGQRGDQFAVIKIVSPRDLTDEARELMQQFANAAPQSPRAGLW